MTVLRGMKPDLSAAALVLLLHQYYPTGLWADEPGYRETEQFQRLQRLLEEARKDTHSWEGFVQRAREEFPSSTFWDSTTLFYDPCYRLRISLPLPKEAEGARDELVCLVSLLAPAYVIYASHALRTGSSEDAWTRYPPLPPGFHPDEVRLAALIESTFSATRLPNEVLFTPVPEMDHWGGNVGLGKALLIDLLFTEDRG
ncbi:hypothetical protein SAMN05444354_11975 [Stigmatella aurantiaca]|uniref:Uncharacterized protein n=1 Tax=Stigmatella aurantiaca TaxID=41 RepID=A0A1H7ZNN9_STIAU|nr:hypothetical protein [Stigmatella aurantiaca]SEM60010.1 hypothetical protein SAMN05444354_11975 [Stigmatella aurantiaca]